MDEAACRGRGKVKVGVGARDASRCPVGASYANGAVVRLPCLAQQLPSCGQRAVYNVLMMRQFPDAEWRARAMADDQALRRLGPLAPDIHSKDVRGVLDRNGGQDVVVIQDFAELPVLFGTQEHGDIRRSDALIEFCDGGRSPLRIVLNTLAPNAYGGSWALTDDENVPLKATSGPSDAPCRFRG